MKTGLASATWVAALAAVLMAGLGAPPAHAFDEAEFKRVQFGGDCKRCDLTGANLSGMNLSAGSFDFADFTGADLTQAKLSGAGLLRANFTNANLTRASLHDADMTRTNFTNANLTGTGLRPWAPILKDATLCNTTMYDGSIENRNCPK